MTVLHISAWSAFYSCEGAVWNGRIRCDYLTFRSPHFAAVGRDLDGKTDWCMNGPWRRYRALMHIPLLLPENDGFNYRSVRWLGEMFAQLHAVWFLRAAVILTDSIFPFHLWIVCWVCNLNHRQMNGSSKSETSCDIDALLNDQLQLFAHDGSSLKPSKIAEQSRHVCTHQTRHKEHRTIHEAVGDGVRDVHWRSQIQGWSREQEAESRSRETEVAVGMNLLLCDIKAQPDI